MSVIIYPPNDIAKPQYIFPEKWKSKSFVNINLGSTEESGIIIQHLI